MYRKYSTLSVQELLPIFHFKFYCIGYNNLKFLTEGYSSESIDGYHSWRLYMTSRISPHKGSYGTWAKGCCYPILMPACEIPWDICFMTTENRKAAFGFIHCSSFLAVRYVIIDRSIGNNYVVLKSSMQRL